MAQAVETLSHWKLEIRVSYIVISMAPDGLVTLHNYAR